MTKPCRLADSIKARSDTAVIVREHGLSRYELIAGAALACRLVKPDRNPRRYQNHQRRNRLGNGLLIENLSAKTQPHRRSTRLDALPTVGLTHDIAQAVGKKPKRDFQQPLRLLSLRTRAGNALPTPPRNGARPRTADPARRRTARIAQKAVKNGWSVARSRTPQPSHTSKHKRRAQRLPPPTSAA